MALILATQQTTPDSLACRSSTAFEFLSLSDCHALQGAPSLDWAYVAGCALLSAPTDQALTSILCTLGMLSGADRAWVFEYDDALQRFRNTHEWCRSRVSSHVEDLQDAPVTLIGWLHRRLMQREAVLIHDVARLPRTARSLQAEMLRQEDKSVLSVPIFSEGRLRACIGFDMTTRQQRWTGVQTLALFQCADLISRAKYGRLVNRPRNPNERLASAQEARFSPLMYLRPSGALRGVTVDDIVGLQAAGNHMDVWLFDGSVVRDLRNLSTWLGLLPATTFLRVHRGAIVNLRHLQDLDRHAGPLQESWAVRLRGVDERWPVSRPYRKALRLKLGA